MIFLIGDAVVFGSDRIDLVDQSCLVDLGLPTLRIERRLRYPSARRLRSLKTPESLAPSGHQYPVNRSSVGKQCFHGCRDCTISRRNRPCTPQTQVAQHRALECQKFIRDLYSKGHRVRSACTNTPPSSFILQFGHFPIFVWK
jgi:hypothetical protein